MLVADLTHSTESYSSLTALQALGSNLSLLQAAREEQSPGNGSHLALLGVSQAWPGSNMNAFTVHAQRSTVCLHSNFS